MELANEIKMDPGKRGPPSSCIHCPLIYIVECGLHPCKQCRLIHFVQDGRPDELVDIFIQGLRIEKQMVWAMVLYANA